MSVCYFNAWNTPPWSFISTHCFFLFKTNPPFAICFAVGKFWARTNTAVRQLFFHDVSGNSSSWTSTVSANIHTKTCQSSSLLQLWTLFPCAYGRNLKPRCVKSAFLFCLCWCKNETQTNSKICVQYATVSASFLDQQGHSKRTFSLHFRSNFEVRDKFKQCTKTMCSHKQ